MDEDTWDWDQDGKGYCKKDLGGVMKSSAWKEHLYTTADVSFICKVTLRQLQWMAENHIVTPMRLHRGFRFYPVEQVLEVMVIRRLKSKGLSLQKMAPALARLRATLNFGHEGEFNIPSPYYLATNGNALFVMSDPWKFIGRLVSFGQMAVLELSELADEIELRGSRRLPQTATHNKRLSGVA